MTTQELQNNPAVQMVAFFMEKGLEFKEAVLAAQKANLAFYDKVASNQEAVKEVMAERVYKRLRGE
jgi:hypothetical protein